MTQAIIATAGFDYSAFPPDIRRTAENLAGDLRAFHRRTVEEAAAFGRRLIAIRNQVEVGTFVRWIEHEVGVGKSSAYRFINLAEAFKPEALSHVGRLGPTVAYSLSSKSVAPEVREDVQRRLEAGEELSGSTVSDLLREARARERMAKADAKLTEKQRRQRAQRQSRQKRDAEADRARWEEERLASERAAADACEILVRRLGADIERIVDLLDAASFYFSVATLRRAAEEAKR